MKQNLCEWLPIKFDTLCYPKLQVEYIIYVAAMLRSKYFRANKGYAWNEFNLRIKELEEANTKTKEALANDLQGTE